MNTQSYVQWSYPGADETGFLLERSTDSGSTWPVHFSFSYTTTNYTDSDVVWYGTYWWRVAATNPIGNGLFSPLASVFIAPPAFDIPRLTGSQVLFLTQSLLQWNYTGSSQGATDFFLLERSVDSGSTWASSSIDPLSSSLLDSNVTYSSTYWYRITPHADFGLYGDASNIVPVFIFAPTPVLAATQSFGLAVQSHVSWSFIGFDTMSLERSLDSGSTWPVSYSLAPGTIDYLDNDVIINGTYWYRVRSTDNGMFYGDYSNTGSVHIVTIPTAPVSFSVVSGSAIASWLSSSKDQTGFQLQKSIDGVNYPETTIISPYTVLTYTDLDVSSSFTGNTYWYRVAAFNEHGSSSFSPTASITFTFTSSGAPPSGSPDISGSISGSTNPPSGSPDISGSISGSI